APAACLPRRPAVVRRGPADPAARLRPPLGRARTPAAPVPPLLDVAGPAVLEPRAGPRRPPQPAAGARAGRAVRLRLGRLAARASPLAAAPAAAGRPRRAGRPLARRQNRLRPPGPP